MTTPTDAPDNVSGSEDHLPESHVGEGVTTHPNAEEASDAVLADTVSVKETSTSASATAATEGDTHIDLDLRTTTTKIEVVSLNPTDEEQQTITAETSDVHELSIEDLLRQAGWESRGPRDPPQKTTLGVDGSASGTAPPSPQKGTTTQQTPKTGDSKNSTQMAKSRATGPPTGGNKGKLAAQDNSKKNDSKKNDSKKTANSTA